MPDLKVLTCITIFCEEIMFRTLVSLTVLFMSSGPLTAQLSEPPNHVRELVAPYLLPEDHSVKKALDEIFTPSRVSTSLATLKNAGFCDIRLRKRGIVFARHPKIPGYVVKLVCDYSAHSFHGFENKVRGQDEYIEFVGRIRKKNLIQEIIDRHNMQGMVCPKKWIYEIPLDTQTRPGHAYTKKFYLLVAEDMDIVPPHDNFTLWKQVNDDFLYDFFVIYRETKLYDCGPPNQSFTRDGRLAFIDTKDWDHSLFTPQTNPHFLVGHQRALWREWIREYFGIK